MSWGAALAIAIPFLFVIGTVMNALKEQKKLENGKLKKILEQRKAEREQYRALHGHDMPSPKYDDDDDWPKAPSSKGAAKDRDPSPKR